MNEKRFTSVRQILNYYIPTYRQKPRSQEQAAQEFSESILKNFRENLKKRIQELEQKNKDTSRVSLHDERPPSDQ